MVSITSAISDITYYIYEVPVVFTEFLMEIGCKKTANYIPIFMKLKQVFGCWM